MSETRDPILEEANRRAHRAARMLTNALDDDHDANKFHYVDWQGWFPELVKAARDYEEIEQRQQAKPEATL